jgi:hypothetical protein
MELSLLKVKIPRKADGEKPFFLSGRQEAVTPPGAGGRPDG